MPFNKLKLGDVHILLRQATHDNIDNFEDDEVRREWSLVDEMDQTCCSVWIYINIAHKSGGVWKMF